jgi:hypothetical protein
MIDFDRSLPRYGAFGFPCHGPVSGQQLTLPNGQTVQISAPQGGDNWLLVVPGAAGATRTPEQAIADEARGWAWPTDVLCWQGGYAHGMPVDSFSPSAAQIQTLARFIYAEGPGQCWLVGLEGVDGGSTGRRLSVSVVPLQAPADEPPVTFSAETPEGVTNSMLPQHLQLVDVSRTGDAAIFRPPVGDVHLLVVRLARSEGVWSAELEYLAGPTPAERTGYSVQTERFSGNVVLQTESVETLAGAWFWNGEEYEYFAEYQGRALATPRVTYSAAVATRDTHPEIAVWSIDWTTQDGSSNWQLGRSIITAWFGEDGAISVLDYSADIGLVATTNFDMTASGSLLKANGTPYYTDGGGGALPGGAPLVDTEYLTGAFSFGLTRGVVEEVTHALRVNGAQVDSAQVRRELQLATTSSALVSTDPDEAFELRGDNYDQISQCVWRASLNVDLYLGGDLVASADVDGVIGTGGSSGIGEVYVDDVILGDFGYPASYSGALYDGTVPPSSTLGMGAGGATVGGNVHRYSNKLAALFTVTGLTAEVRDAYSPSGLRAGTGQLLVGDYPGSSLRGSYNSRNEEAVTAWPAITNLNWA